jgi:hypothetical protein
VKRLLLLAAVTAALAAPAAAHATNECKGLMVCVPVTGPWVLTSAAESVQYDLTCPKNYLVAGLDAELSVRGIDIGFVGALGSPVNPGITTQRDAVFLGRLVHGRAAAPSFRPHIGCVPTQGGGQRTPTAYHAFPPSKPVDRKVQEVKVARDRVIRVRCPKNETLASATHAVGFYGAAPPTAAQAKRVSVTQRVANGVATFTIRARVAAAVQINPSCVKR